jgi:hypothetical protein
MGDTGGVCPRGVFVRHSTAQNHDPEQEHADVDALPQPNPRRRLIGLQTWSFKECQGTKCEEHHGRRDGEKPEWLAERRRSKPDREEHEEDRHATEHDMHGVAQRASAGSQYFPLVHRGKRPQEPKRRVGQDQTADDSQGTILSGGSPDAPAKGGDQ